MYTKKQLPQPSKTIENILLLLILFLIRDMNNWLTNQFTTHSRIGSGITFVAYCLVRVMLGQGLLGKILSRRSLSRCFLNTLFTSRVTEVVVSKDTREVKYHYSAHSSHYTPACITISN